MSLNDLDSGMIFKGGDQYLSRWSWGEEGWVVYNRINSEARKSYFKWSNYL